MFSVRGDATVANVTDLRRKAKSLLERVDHGETVVLQRNSEAVGILISYPAYEGMMLRLGQLENISLAIRALRREERIMENKDVLVPLEEMLAEW